MGTALQMFKLPSERRDTLVLRLPTPARNGSDWFFELCQINEGLQLERTAEGEVLVMAPTGGESGYREGKVFVQLDGWAERDGAGRAFNSNTGFILPNGSSRAPDASWVRMSRLAKLAAKQKKKFLPLCPDFVVEVLSPSDHLASLQAKMEEYRNNGASLGWLIDPRARKVHIYRTGKRVERVHHPTRLNGDPELPGFVLNLARIWKPDI